MTAWRKAIVAWCPICEGNRGFIPTRFNTLVCAWCKTRLVRPTKFGNVPERNASTGRFHQSKAEGRRATELLALERSGAITNVRGLHRDDSQETFRLDVYATPEVEVLLAEVAMHPDDERLTRCARDVERSLIRIARYQADFTYTSNSPEVGPVGEKIVEDVKGYRTPTYRMKRALMLAAHGIEIREIDARYYRQHAKRERA
jgi:hypothetical protein